MILTGKEIFKQVEKGNITITPYDSYNSNPNSYNYRIGNTFSIVTEEHSIKNEYNSLKINEIPESGLLLQPNIVYLACTYEIIGSNKFVPILTGRSSLGRLGLFLELSADLGNLGPAHKWTLELTCVQPIIIYPYMKIGQVSFWVPTGEIKEYRGKYSMFDGPAHNIYCGKLSKERK